jgi:S1-C subfamily serine protease
VTRTLTGIVVLLVMALAASAGVEAQSRDDIQIRVHVDSVSPLMTGFVTMRRAHLGMNVNLRAGDTDRYGALINSVSPNGPADRAGIRSGDIIVVLNDESLLDDEHVVTAEDGSSVPGLRLIAVASKLDPDDTINVELRRDDRTKLLSLVTESWPTMVREWTTPEGDWGVKFGEDSLLVEFEKAMPRVRTRVLSPGGNLFFADPLFELELAPMNAELGGYFGTSSGVLVISVPEGSGLGLKGGDVVLAVDGRATENPSHLHRILRSYQSDEGFELSIMRNLSRLTVQGALRR